MPQIFRSLDLSFNCISEIEGLEHTNALETLYMANNKIKKINELHCLAELKVLELGANEIIVDYRYYDLFLRVRRYKTCIIMPSLSNSF